MMESMRTFVADRRTDGAGFMRTRERVLKILMRAGTFKTKHLF